MRHLVRNVGVVLLAAIAFVAVSCGADQGRNPFPRVDEIAKITAEVYREAIGVSSAAGDSLALAEFEIPAARWGALLRTFRPCREDSDPAKWMVTGDLTIERTDGTIVRVSLFQIRATKQKPGAFAVRVGDGERVYYRGGSETALNRELRTVLEESESRR